MSGIFYASVNADPVNPQAAALLRGWGTAAVHRALLGAQDKNSKRLASQINRLGREHFIVDRELDDTARELQGRLNHAANTLLRRGDLAAEVAAALRRRHWAVLVALREQAKLRALLAELPAHQTSEENTELTQAEARTVAEIEDLEHGASAQPAPPAPAPVPADLAAGLRDARLAVFRADHYNRDDPDAKLLPQARSNNQFEEH